MISTLKRATATFAGWGDQPGGRYFRAGTQSGAHPLDLVSGEPLHRVHRLTRHCLFDGTIAQLVSLAALMPIVAGIGGNTGHQTITMIVRAAALHQLEKGNAGFLILRELGVAIINGLVWGGIMGIVTWLLYGEAGLGGVMMLAMLLNLLLAALMGVLIPLLMIRIGHDPAVGSSVMMTAITDTGGFFIFLGLATLFHIH